MAIAQMMAYFGVSPIRLGLRKCFRKLNYSMEAPPLH